VLNGCLPGAFRKRPHFVYRRDRAPIGFAGLAETWIGPNGEELDTVAIVTVPASADLAVLHDRVPVTIAPGDFDRNHLATSGVAADFWLYRTARFPAKT
jgi:putative SOS response-associated peptidase YedK